MESGRLRSGFASATRTFHRRAWLAGVFALAIRGSRRSAAVEESEEGKDVESYAKKQGFKSFRNKKSKHYIAIGNAPDDYLRITLRDCETVALDYMDHFRRKGFELAFPDDRMTAVVLADEREYVKFLGRDPNALGLYWHNTNWLVVQDFRNVPMYARRGGAANLRVLAHEATHQLTFNTGMLNRTGDTPGCIAEGLGSYGEIRRPDVRVEPGQINNKRLDDLAHMRRALGWIPLERLVTDDVMRRPSNSNEQELYYAQSWLLVHYMLTEPARLPQFRDYLKTIFKRKNGRNRLEDARAHWGDLDKLDTELKRYSVRLLTKG